MQDCDISLVRFNTYGRLFTDDDFKCISLKISLKFVRKFIIDNIPALVQIMAWHRSGDKPLSEPVVVNLLTHICVTWPEWVNRTGAEIRIIWANFVSTVVTGVLTSCLTMLSLSKHDIFFAGSTGPCLPAGRISATCAILVFKKCKYIFMFPKTNFLFVPVIQGQRPIVCQFEPPIQDKMHVKPEVWQMGLTHLPLDKNGRHFGRRHFQLLFLVWKW